MQLHVAAIVGLMDEDLVSGPRDGEGRPWQLRGGAIVAPCELFAVAATAQARTVLFMQVTKGYGVMYDAAIAHAWGFRHGRGFAIESQLGRDGDMQGYPMLFG